MSRFKAPIKDSAAKTCIVSAYGSYIGRAFTELLLRSIVDLKLSYTGYGLHRDPSSSF